MKCLELLFTWHLELVMSFFDIILLDLGLFCQFQCFCYNELSSVLLFIIEVSDLNVKLEEQVQLIARCFFLKYSLALFQSPVELFYETRRHDYQLLRGEATHQVSHVWYYNMTLV